MNMCIFVLCVNVYPHIPWQVPNDEMYWVVTTVVSETRSDMRAKLIKHFVKIASEQLCLVEFQYFIDSCCCQELAKILRITTVCFTS